MNATKPTIRSAQAEDRLAISTLLESVKLPTAGVSDHLPNFLILEDGGKIVGCVGLEVYGSKALLRSLAIAKEWQRKGLGGALYEAAVERARRRGLDEIYLLTETAEKFFAARGFESISRAQVVDSVKNSVEFRSACPQSAICMSLKLR
jgi:amino-acid N-acetyltransferase